MSRHFSHYLVLFGILATAVFGWLTFSYDRAFQIALIIATAASYVTWGVVHHFLHDDLYFEVVAEYLAIAVLGGILALSIFV